MTDDRPYPQLDHRPAQCPKCHELLSDTITWMADDRLDASFSCHNNGCDWRAHVVLEIVPPDEE